MAPGSPDRAILPAAHRASFCGPRLIAAASNLVPNTLEASLQKAFCSRTVCRGTRLRESSIYGTDGISHIRSPGAAVEIPETTSQFLRNDVLGSSRASTHRVAKVSGENAPMKLRIRHTQLSETPRTDAPTRFTTALSPARKSSLIIERPSHHGNFPVRRPDGQFSRPAFIYDRSSPNISPLAPIPNSDTLQRFPMAEISAFAAGVAISY